MLRHDEGEKLKIYKDSEGYYTVGIGHLITKNPDYKEAVRILGSETITQERSVQLFNEDVQEAVRGINRSVLNKSYTKMNEARQAALVNMVFQLGLQGVLGFKKMLSCLDSGNYQEAAREALDSRWAKQTPNRAQRVTDVLSTGTFDAYR